MAWESTEARETCQVAREDPALQWKRQRDDAPGQAEDELPAEAPPAKRIKLAADAPLAAKPSHDASAEPAAANEVLQHLN